MAAPKQPQDHKAKAEKAEEYFTFEVEDKTYTAKNKTKDVMKPSFLRRIRHEDDFFQMCSILEALVGDDEEAIDAFDSIIDSDDDERANNFGKALMAHTRAVTGAELGESKAS